MDLDNIPYDDEGADKECSPQVSSRRSVSMKVALFAPTPSGGHPEYVAKLVGGLLENDAEIEVYWPVRADLRRDLILPGRIVLNEVMPKLIPKEALSRRAWIAERINFRKRYDYAFMKWLKTAPEMDVLLIEEHQRFTLPLLIFLARRMKVKTIVHLHNIVPHEGYSRFLGRLERFLMGRALAGADLVLTHGQSLSMAAKREYGLTRSPGVIPHGLSAKRRDVKGNIGSRVLFYGVNRPNKGLDLLIQAIDEKSLGVELTVAGATPPALFNKTRSMLMRLPKYDWINNFIDDELTDVLFSTTDLVALPYRDFIAQSGVLHLAIEWGVPVVASDVGALGGTVSELGIGLAIPPNNASKLAEAISALLVPEVNRKCQLACFAAQDRLSWFAVGEVLHDHIKQLGHISP